MTADTAATATKKPIALIISPSQDTYLCIAQSTRRRHDWSPKAARAFIDRSSGIWNFRSTEGSSFLGFAFGRSRKVNAMKKTLMALAAVATLAVATASPAQAWRGGWWGPGIAAGILGGAIVGGAIANSRYYYGPGYYGAGYPGYYGPPYAGAYGPCYWQTQRFWNGYGWQMRNVRVCGSDRPY
jgi:hypothetical protein